MWRSLQSWIVPSGSLLHLQTGVRFPGRWGLGTASAEKGRSDSERTLLCSSNQAVDIPCPYQCTASPSGYRRKPPFESSCAPRLQPCRNDPPRHLDWVTLQDQHERFGRSVSVPASFEILRLKRCHRSGSVSATFCQVESGL